MIKKVTAAIYFSLDCFWNYNQIILYEKKTNRHKQFLMRIKQMYTFLSTITDPLSSNTQLNINKIGPIKIFKKK